ncbi:MAG: HEAT repeat domain-containing protein [Verrucomicrobia bacterium]|nr:HEAT repeat domain-containing protein [Verrucomicrobiota bacterium]
MNRFVSSPGALLGGSLALLLGWTAAAQTPVANVTDFDHDGSPETRIDQPGKSVLQKPDGSPADFQLPEDVSALDAQGRDRGLHFVDLNGDGFDDVLLSNSQEYALHLWNRNVQPHLGWTKGWSQVVRAGRRTGLPEEPPSLVGVPIRLLDGTLLLDFPATATGPARTERLSAKELIAVRMTPPKSPEEALASMRLREGFEIELVAAEPLVVDPVYLDWDAQGRLWVVEMRDYPLGMDGKGQPGGRVNVLYDDNADGRMDRVVPFLTDIPFPSSVLPYGKGALIAAAPDLFYTEDTNGDGRADVRRVLFTGFNPGNQQHRFNGFEWGLDGWLYLANGDSGGTVKSLETGQSLSISGRDLRVNPETGAMETVSAQTQFGRRRDDWGNWFGNNNPTWLWHVTLPEHYLRRNPQVAVKRVSEVLAQREDSTRTFPASAPQIRPNQPWSLNHVTSGCSPTPYRDDLFGPDFATSVFISEPVHNVIHREVLSPRGSGLQSQRAVGEERSEFLASTDNWFRPTTLRTGPDGALYVADMYRFSLEHPEWIPAEMLARMNVRAGDDRGRIYRIAPRGAPRRSIPRLASLDTAGLVAALDSPNGWQRDLAQRLLLERREASDSAGLRELLRLTHPPQVRVQALSTLGLRGALDIATIRTALSDPHPGVRRQALEQSERLAAEAELFPAVTALAQDPDAAVRLQAAFTLGQWPAELSEPVLRDLAARDPGDERVRLAILTSLRPESALFKELKSGQTTLRPATTPEVKPSSTDRAQVIAQYAATAALKGNPTRGHMHFTALCASCHRLRGEGQEVGPDLNMVATKPVDWMLLAILDPSQAVETRYRAWTLQLTDGEILTGLIAAETANNLVLRYAGTSEQPILRSQIRSIEPQPGSLMPAGFESALQPQDLADLLAWIRGE